MKSKLLLLNMERKIAVNRKFINNVKVSCVDQIKQLR